MIHQRHLVLIVFQWWFYKTVSPNFKCLKVSCFPDCWKVSLVVPVFKNVAERSTAKNYPPVSLLSLVSKVFEGLVNNRIVDHLEKSGLFSDFQHAFRYSQSTTNLLTVVSDRIARAFNRSRATQTVAVDILQAFNRVWHAGLLHKLRSSGISVHIFGLISSFFSNRQHLGGSGWEVITRISSYSRTYVKDHLYKTTTSPKQPLTSPPK